ncbi:MAG: glycoside hydrolase family 43 protein [Kiritimatiellaeota bacterium]|nr:glycoside hydrolase family 43 protein [Kiritimatiellota bacterium]
MMKTADIQIRDPFVLPEPQERFYYLFGTTDKNCWKGAGEGFDCFRSKDLGAWEGPMPVFRPPPSFWGTNNFWAPEVYRFHDRYYMFASFKADRCYRGTQILSATRVTGPYVPLTDGPITPADWECLDGTLHVDSDGNPWIIFCHEWVQVHNGAMYAMRLSPDLKKPAGRPVFLFNASEAPWVFHPKWPEKQGEFRFPTYVTDGPFLFRNRNGILLMLWSSSGSEGYAMGIARSESGVVTGPWRQDAVPLWAKDGGHGMIFRGFDGRLFVTFHMPNKTPKERPVFIEIEDTDIGVRLKAESPNKQYAGKGK